MSPSLTALPDRPPHGAHRIGCTGKRRGLEEMPSNAATAKKRNGQNPALSEGGRCIDETALRRDAAACRRDPAFRCGGTP